MRKGGRDSRDRISGEDGGVLAITSSPRHGIADGEEVIARSPKEEVGREGREGEREMIILTRIREKGASITVRVASK